MKKCRQLQSPLGGPLNFKAFHCSFESTKVVHFPQSCQRNFSQILVLILRLTMEQPVLPLRLVKTGTARSPRFTASAGTRLDASRCKYTHILFSCKLSFTLLTFFTQMMCWILLSHRLSKIPHCCTFYFFRAGPCFSPSVIDQLS